MFQYNSNTETDVLEIEEVAVEEQIDIDKHMLIVHNDDVNTFDWVIESLIKVCKHSPEQAEQCTLIIHFKGKCDVKYGTFKQLKPMKDAILDRGINATIEEVE